MKSPFISTTSQTLLIIAGIIIGFFAIKASFGNVYNAQEIDYDKVNSDSIRLINTSFEQIIKLK